MQREREGGGCSGESFITEDGQCVHPNQRQLDAAQAQVCPSRLTPDVVPQELMMKSTRNQPKIAEPRFKSRHIIPDQGVFEGFFALSMGMK